MRIVREPLLQFLCIALILFTVNRLVNGPEKYSASQQITISSGQVEQISEQYRLLAGRAPGEQELRALVDDFIDEEIAYREAIALGLDTDDTIVRRRMRQKLEFLVRDQQSYNDPSDEELSIWLAAHATNYHQTERISFRHVLASHDKRGEHAQKDAHSFRQALEAGAEFEALGDTSMLPPSLSLSTQDNIASLFGDAFAKAVFAAQNNEWSAPIQSAYGYHLILITERIPSRPSTLNEIRETLKADWMAAKKQEARNKYLENLRQRYTVNVEWPAKHSSEQ
ncbi:MAG: hypothetical protein COB36_13585 [Alphaproteobacteria bacterium]|nr:MAG: hypothetical protein COB36_13585 [Alphaproteobacteria bacterium]